MNNGMKMTVKILLIVMLPKIFLFWGPLVNAMMGEKFQKVQYDPPTIKRKRVNTVASAGNICKNEGFYYSKFFTFYYTIISIVHIILF